MSLTYKEVFKKFPINSVVEDENGTFYIIQDYVDYCDGLKVVIREVGSTLITEFNPEEITRADL